MIGMAATPGPRRRVKLAHVARAAGVSVPTASKALNGTGRISPETAARITAIADQLGYRPDATARSLRIGPESVVAAIIDRRETDDAGYTPALFWLNFNDELINCLAHQELGLLFTTAQASLTIRSHPVSAVLLLSSDPASMDHPQALPEGLPVSHYALAEPDPSATVVFRHDFDAAIADALRALVDCGSRHPAAIIGTRRRAVADIFIAAYERWCAGAGVDPLVVQADLAEISADFAVTSAIDQGADGIFCFDIRTADVVAAIARRGLRIPDDICLIAQAEGELEQVLTPSVSTLSLMGRRCAHICAETLVEAIYDGTQTTVQLPYEVVERASTARKPGRV